MIGLELPIDRVVEYLYSLSPDQRADLLVELDRRRLNGEKVPGSDQMLHELRRIVGSAKDDAPRAPSPSRLFFIPMEPFLVDHVPLRLRRGRIARTSLAAIWSWLCRDVMPRQATAYAEQAKSAVLAGDMPAALQLMRDFQDTVLELIGHAHPVVSGTDALRDRLVAYGGPTRSLDDLQEMLRIFRMRDALEAATAGLPEHFVIFGEEAALQVCGALDQLHLDQPDAWFYALVVLTYRLDAPWQLIRLAMTAARTNSALRIAEDPYAAAVDLVLQDLEDLAVQLRIALASGWSTTIDETLSGLHEAISGISAELDFTGETSWSRQLANVRQSVSALLCAELAVVPKRIAWVLTPPAHAARRQIAPGSAEVDAAMAGIGFASALERHARNFQLEPHIRRMREEATAEIERSTAALLVRIMTGNNVERINCVLQVEIAARLAAMLRGLGYAASFARAAEAVAGQMKVAAG
jgi:hypothetical protein